MRILHVYRTYFPDTEGGVQETIRQICLATKGIGAEPRVFALSRGPEPAVVHRREAAVYRCQQTAEVTSCGISIRAFAEFGKHVEWADVVHYHFPWPFADVLHFATRRKKPAIATYHSDIVRQRILFQAYRPMMNRFLDSLDKIVCTSPNYFATSPVMARFADKVKVIPIGIDEHSYPQPDTGTMEEVEREFGRDFFLFVGVLRYYKGLHILLDALVGKSYPVLIVGSGPTEQVLKRQAKRLGLRHVTFAGRVSDAVKVALFRLCKGVVFPSHLRSEAFGVTLLEGAMCSKPLISTEVGTGTSHVNHHNRTGLVVQPGVPQALAGALDTLHSDSALVEQMGEAARDRYQTYFTGQVMGERYMELYRSVSGRAIVEEKDTQFTGDGLSRPDRRSRPLLHTESVARRFE